ncbi:MAG: LysR family transcriptional regulator [Stappiaceae bacterium]
MNEIDWDDLRLFLAVAKAGGLGAATALTGKSAPTLGRRMLELERHLGRELFVRKPRGYDLTEDGCELLVKIGGIETRVLDLIDTETHPLVKISAGTWVTSVLLRSVVKIKGSMSLRLRFTAEEDLADIGRREAIIGVRNHRPTEVGLAGRKIGQVKFAVYARDAGICTWARVVSTTPSAIWLKGNSSGADVIEVTTPQNALDLALAGTARAVLPTFIGDTRAELIAISDTIEELDHDQWLVTHHEDRFLPEVRHVIDRIYTVLKKAYAAG